MKDVTIYKGNGRFRPDIGFEATESRIVQPNHCFVAIDQLPVIAFEENPAVPDHSAGRILPVRDRKPVLPVDRVLHLSN